MRKFRQDQNREEKTKDDLNDRFHAFDEVKASLSKDRMDCRGKPRVFLSFISKKVILP